MISRSIPAIAFLLARPPHQRLWIIGGTILFGSIAFQPAQAQTSTNGINPGIAGNPGKPEAIIVTAFSNRPHLAGKINGGALGSRSELDTPFSVRSVNAAQLDAHQALDISAAFASDPSVILANSGVGAASGSSFKIRGLAIDNLNGYKLDGLAIPYWSIDLPVENFEQVQLLKGATAFMYGFGAPGGVVNFQLKHPLDIAHVSLEAGYRSDSLFRETLDTGGPVDAKGRFTYRLVLAHEQGDVFNNGYMRRDSMSFAADAKVTSNLHANVSLFYLNTEQDNMINTASAASTVTFLPTISGRTQLGAEGSQKANDMKVVTSGLVWDITSGWTNTLSYRYSQLDENFPGSLLTFLDDRGDYRSNAFFIEREWWYNQIQDISEGHFRTGPFSHDIVAGVSWENQSYDTDANATSNIVVSTGNIFSSTPTLGAHSAAAFYNPKLYKFIDYTQVAPFFSDTIGWRRWSLLGGFRYTAYHEHDYLPTGATSAVHDSNPITPVASISYKITSRTNVYFSYVKAMQAGGQAAATNVNFNQVFGPIQSSQYEVGIKTQQSRWSATAAAYRMDTGAAYTNSQNFYVQSGKSRYQGVEFSGGFQASRDLILSGGISYLDARYVQTSAAYVGHRLEGTPNLQASADAHYDFPFLRGLSFDVDFRYVGSLYDNAANTLLLPSYTTWDLGANYVTHIAGRRVTFRALTRNIGGSRYWITYGNLSVLPGDPRTVSLNARVDF